jgi:hypothetical protein
VEFGEWLCEEILRRYFLYDRSLLSDLSRCGWESLKVFFQETLFEEDAVPGTVMAISRLGIARYIVRASFSKERMSYIPEESKVSYRSKDGKEEKRMGHVRAEIALVKHVLHERPPLGSPAEVVRE